MNPISCPFCKFVPDQLAVVQRVIAHEFANENHIETCASCGGRYLIQIELKSRVILLRRPVRPLHAQPV